MSAVYFVCLADDACSWPGDGERGREKMKTRETRGMMGTCFVLFFNHNQQTWPKQNRFLFLCIATKKPFHNYFPTFINRCPITLLCYLCFCFFFYLTDASETDCIWGYILCHYANLHAYIKHLIHEHWNKYHLVWVKIFIKVTPALLNTCSILYQLTEDLQVYHDNYDLYVTYDTKVGWVSSFVFSSL